MKKIFTKKCFLMMWALALGAIVPVWAQTYTSKVLGTNLGISAMCKDAAGNVYTVQTVSTAQNATQQNAQIVKYAAGTTTPTVLTGTTFQYSEYESTANYAFGLAVDGNGNIFVTTYNDYFPGDGRDVTTYGKILKMTPAGGNNYNQSTWVTGQYTSGNKIGDFGALAIDSHNNLFVDTYNDADGKYEIVEYPAGSTAPTVIYTHIGDPELASGDNYTAFFALAFDPSDNLYAGTSFDTDNNTDGGKILQLTKASNYVTVNQVLAGGYCSALATDASGRLYASLATFVNGTGLTSGRIVKFSSDFTSNTSLYTGMSHDGSYEPWGLAVPNASMIFAGIGGGTVNGAGHLGDLAVLFSTPATQASNVTFVTTKETSATINWTNGDGLTRAVFVKAANSGTPVPVNNTTYTANTAFGNAASQIGSTGWYCVYNGTGTSVGVTGLSANTAYRAMVVEYNGTPGSENYNINTATNNPNNVTTAANPVLALSGSAPSYTVGSPAVAVDGGITITNGFGTITSATVNISAALAAGDALNFVNQNGITGVYNSGTGALSLTGAATVANYQTALQSVTFSSTAGSSTTRSVSFQVNDGVANSNTVTKNVAVQIATTITAATAATGSPTNAASVNYNVTFAAPVTGLSASNFTVTQGGSVTGASVTNVTGSGASYTVTVGTGTGDGTVQLVMSNATGISPGVSNLPFNGNAYTIDKTLPTIVISRTDPNPIKDNVLDFQAVFSKPVTNVNPADFTMTNSGVTTGAISVSDIGNHTIYNITVNSVAGTGTARLDLNGGTDITDAAGNVPAAYTGGQVYDVDQTPPAITSDSYQSSNSTSISYAKTGDNVTLSIGFDQHVSVSTLTIGGHAVTPNNVFGNVWQGSYTVTGSDPDGHMSFEIIVTDDAGNTLDATSDNVVPGGVYVTVDNTPPAVNISAPSVTSIVAGSAGTVTYDVTYADANFNTSTLTTGDITLNTTGTAGGTIGLSGSGANYTVTISNITGIGTLGISIGANTASDLAGNLANASAASATFDVASSVPVTWLSFDIKQTGNLYNWNWALATEENVAYYSPQYSTDGIHFTDAGKITTLNSDHSYHFSTSLSLNGNTYFRVKEVDKDGKATYSAIQTLNAAPSAGLSFYPNPATSQIWLKWPYADAGSLTIIIYDNNGREVLKQRSTMSFPLKVSVSGLAPGTYFIQCVDDKQRLLMAPPLLKTAN